MSGVGILCENNSRLGIMLVNLHKLIPLQTFQLTAFPRIGSPPEHDRTRLTQSSPITKLPASGPPKSHHQLHIYITCTVLHIQITTDPPYCPSYPKPLSPQMLATVSFNPHSIAPDICPSEDRAFVNAFLFTLSWDANNECCASS
jgi:hypothetical protein